MDQPAAALDRRRRPAKAGRGVGRVAFALTPWVTVGFGTPIAFLLVAQRYSYLGRAHARVLWISVAVYMAVLFSAIAALLVLTTADDMVGAICTGAWALIMVLAGGLEAFALVMVAAVQGYQPRARSAPRPAPMSEVDGYRDSRRGASRVVSYRGGAGPGEPSGTVPRAEAGRSAPAGILAAALARGRPSRVDWVLGLGALGLMVAMGLALLQFQQASSCAALVPSHPCVASLRGVVSAPSRTQERSGFRGSRYTVYSIVVTVRESGQRVEIDGWNPGALGVRLWIGYGSAVAWLLLWRVGLVDPSRHPRGPRAEWCSVFGWMFLLVVVIAGISVLWTGFSAPAVYLCGW